MVCPNCKSPVSEDMRFCGECGFALSGAGEIRSDPPEESVPAVQDVPAEEADAVEETGEEICEECEAVEETDEEEPLEAEPVEETDAPVPEELPEGEQSPERVKLRQAAIENAQKAGALAKEGARKMGIFARKTGKKVSKAAKTGAEKAGKLVKEGSEKAGKLVKEGSEKAGKLVKEGSEKAGKLMKDGSEKAGKLMKDGSEKAGKLVKDAARKVKGLPKHVLSAGVAVLAVVVVVAEILVLCGVFGGDGSYGLYLKDQQIVSVELDRKTSAEVTSRLLDDVDLDNGELAAQAETLSAYTVLCGDRLFYPDKLSEDRVGMTIYYRELNRKKEPTKLDSDVICYAVAENGREVVYLKGEEGRLYRSNLKEKEKLASDVAAFAVTQDLKNVLYVTQDMSVYFIDSRGNQERVVSDIEQMYHISEDLKTVCYSKDGNLYVQQVGKNRVKIGSDVESVIHVWPSGKLYYTVYEQVELDVWDFVSDDMKNEDQNMLEPEKPEYPDEPETPYRWDYNTESEYNRAKENYEKACADYDAICQSIAQQYADACEAYQAKLERDKMRQELNEWEGSYDSYRLYFYDGTKSVKVLEDLTGSQAVDYAADVPAAVFRVYGSTRDVCIPLSQLESVSQLTSDLQQQRDENIQYCVTGEGKTAEPFTDSQVCALYIRDDGKQVALVTELNERRQEADLYTAKVQTGRELKPELLEEAVYPGFIRYLPNGSLAYFMDVDNKGVSGDLYIDGKQVDFDVAGDSLSYSRALDACVYYTDYDARDGMGTLKIWQAQKTRRVADDVHDYRVSGDGTLYYLYDFSNRHHTGDLYMYEGSKNRRIDEDVAALMYAPGVPGTVCGSNVLR